MRQKRGNLKMSDFKRITVEEVILAYRSSGFTPMTGGYFLEAANGQNYACAIGALAYSKNPSRPDGALSSFMAEFPHEYMNGFVEGFDAASLRPLPPSKSGRYNTGHDDGQKVRAAVSPKRSYAELKR
jgi:hypothetical protein